jgi:tetratricopeptide (TPR) repeat protein
MDRPISPTDSRRFWLGAAVLAGITLLAYLPAFRGGFVWDDDSFLTQNPLVRASDGLRRFWFTTQAADYWPVTSSTLWLEWRLWGMNAAGYHATNVALHIAEVAMIWAILRRLAMPGAFLAALLFAIHPVNVESVTWIAQRKNLTAMLFYLASIYCFLRTDWFREGTGSRGPSPPIVGTAAGRIDPFYWLSLLAFILAMLSKGSVAPLPIVLLGLIAWRRLPATRDLLSIAPFFAVGAVLAAVNVWFQTHGSAVVIRTAGFWQRLLGAGAVVWFYLSKALWPTRLIFVYPQWRIAAGDLLWWIPLVAAIGTTVFLGWKARLRPSGYAAANFASREIWWRAAFFAWVYFCVMLIPVMGFADIAFMEYSLVANHYQHLAIIGVICLAAAGWSQWADRSRVLALGSAAVVVFALFCLTWRQNETYRDLETLYRATLAENPDSWVAHGNLGSLLAGTGRLEEAMPHFVEALRINPDYPQARVSLGSALANTGHMAEAIAQFEAAVRIRPQFAEGHYNLGLALQATGRPGEALDEFEQAVRYKPDSAPSQYQLGLALARAGRTAEAILHFEDALKYNPNLADAENNLGVALAQSGRTAEAVSHFEAALRIRPDFPAARANLQTALRAP